MSSGDRARAQWMLAAFSLNDRQESRPPGPTRTQSMTNVVREMIELAPRLNRFETRESLEDDDPGTRLGAYAFLYARPGCEFLKPLLDSVIEIEKRPFGQYWGILAIAQVVKVCAKVGPAVHERLEGLLAALEKGTDRHAALSRILESLIPAPTASGRAGRSASRR